MKLDYLKTDNNSLLLINCLIKNNQIEAKICFIREFIKKEIQFLSNETVTYSVKIPSAFLNRKKPYTGVMLESVKILNN